MLSSPLFSLVLITLLSADALVFGFTYGLDNVRIPPLSILLLSLISAVMLTLSFLCGDLFRFLLPPILQKLLPFLVLFLLALYKLYDALPALHASRSALTTGQLSCRINAKNPQTLSPLEAAALALTLSVDNICAGLGIGTCCLPVWLLLCYAVAVHAAAILIGHCSGRHLSRHRSGSLSLISSLLLFVLAVLQLL